MKNNKLTSGFLTGNLLKLIALISMTCDHVGKYLLPNLKFLQIFGRLAFPIFAYMIAEGCRYTKNKTKYLLRMLISAFICQLFYFFALKSSYQCILVTFSLSIMLIFTIDNVKKKKSSQSITVLFSILLCIYILTLFLPKLLSGTGFDIDYGLWGVLLPAAVFFADKKTYKLVFLSIILIIISAIYGGIQWYSLIAVALLAFYNGKRGKRKLKSLFYIYYPAHLAVIYLVAKIINLLLQRGLL